MKLMRGLPLLFACATVASAQVAPPAIEIAPRSNSTVQRMVVKVADAPNLSHAEKLRLIRQHIKYVFILFQENRSFDFYFATYPGADGLYSKSADQIAGFTQPIVNLDGTIGTISPFKIPASVVDANGKTVPLYPTDIASVNHSHLGIAHKLDLDANSIAQNDRYALTEEGVTLIDGKPSKLPTLERKQFGELVMSHVDCDAAPFLWSYADRFTLFDHFFDTVIGPSGPNAIAMIAGQSGETQWMLHPNLAEGKNGTALPMVANAHPYWGLAQDAAGNPAQPKPTQDKNPAPNLTFATLPLSFMGSDIEKTTAADYNPVFDLMDVQGDIKKIAGHGVPAINWGWYQQGYGHEPTDPVGIATHKNYVIHHNGPQYFGYVSDNPEANIHMHPMGAFFDDVAARRLPSSGVFYVRGGYGNIASLPPADPNPHLATVFNGNDDHPGYADSGISEAFLAKEINAIAQSPYWNQSAILIAYDESDGLYDHARPRVRSHDAAGVPLDQGPRIPFLLISPYGVAHGVSHELSEHSSIIKFVDELFNLIPLADLPDEERARKIGLEQHGQKDLGPADDKVEGVGDLFSGFDNLRLLGKRKPLSPSYAEIPEAQINSFPHMGGQGCHALGITPTDSGKPNPIPADFNPRPDTTPGIPTSGTWIP
ncbi:phospholipase C [Granulicella arctica]|uniref:Phospholipase C n=1 Tax=Granulicella arctica TaxID=940613 RepID=A0A7Y9PFX8_9BACT|nr:alkaline phosphatase family protein [Granulicella arctica]NYF78411.1 phospholipase C [Granulicella arctica]